jgi:hypothetical protein
MLRRKLVLLALQFKTMGVCRKLPGWTSIIITDLMSAFKGFTLFK